MFYLSLFFYFNLFLSIFFVILSFLLFSSFSLSSVFISFKPYFHFFLLFLKQSIRLIKSSLFIAISLSFSYHFFLSPSNRLYFFLTVFIYLDIYHASQNQFKDEVSATPIFQIGRLCLPNKK